MNTLTQLFKLPKGSDDEAHTSHGSGSPAAGTLGQAVEMAHGGSRDSITDEEARELLDKFLAKHDKRPQPVSWGWTGGGE